jgi:class 3 adenylate cyclase
VLTSKEVLEQTGISRATLNNYIAGGLLPRPDVLPPEEGAAPRIGFFPDGTVERIQEIQRLKSEGWSMARIAQHFEHGGSEPATAARSMPPPVRLAGPARVAEPAGRAGLPGLADVEHAAYSVNTDFQVLWSNTGARSGELGALLALPAPEGEPVSVMACLLRGRARERDDLVGFHLQVARQRNVAAASLCRGLGPEDSQRVLSAYAATPVPPAGSMPHVSLPDIGGQALGAHAVHLRRGVLFLYAAEAAALSAVPAAAAAPAQRRPAKLARVAVLAARLQDSAMLWQQLPPQEFFELANDVCDAAVAVIGAAGGRQARQDGEGVGAFFAARPGNAHLQQAVIAAQQLREAMREVSRRWQLRKGWTRELWLNVGLAEGEDWIAGTAQADGTLAVLMGDASQQALVLAECASGGSVWATRGLLAKLAPQHRGDLRFGARFNGDFIDGCFMRAADIGPGPRPATEASFPAAEIQAAPPAAAASSTAAQPPLHS